ncbi:indolethylamine N-methyltransferase-like [Ixodes scapularis]|uniref:indolethylamine N-methyltransferase-like n=1 Tax=Ixodes scapularis TaxID=6945 RepID=UPI001A9F0A96|nr:indolethylamine N-methyltransferase-like [Ixodes scapularis]
MFSKTIALRNVLKVTTAAMKFESRRFTHFSHKPRSYSSKVLGTMDSQAVRAAYKENFPPRAFMEMYGHFKGEVSAFRKELHDIFRSDLAQGETLLDVGSGPILLAALLASSRFKHIVLSDLVEGNRLELNKWLDKSEDAIDWTHRAEQIAALEGYSDIKKGALEILECTRSAIRKVVPCDVLEPGVLPEEHRETFDVVMSAGCLDCATTDHEAFRMALFNVGTLVKNGGLLLLLGTCGLKSYTVGSAEFPHANLTEGALKKAVTDAHFQIKDYRTKKEVGFETSEAFMFLLAARKAKFGSLD